MEYRGFLMDIHFRPKYMNISYFQCSISLNYLQGATVCVASGAHMDHAATSKITILQIHSHASGYINTINQH